MIENLIPDLIEIIKKANKKVMKIYEKDFTIYEKNDKSPLTEADLESNKIICDGLLKINEKHKINSLIISEENKNQEYNERSQNDYCWLVDPIDGTKEFIKKNGEFTTNIGLIYNNKVIFGIVGIPVLNLIYYGGEGIPSKKLNYKEGITKLIFPRKERNPYIVVVSRSHMNNETKSHLEDLPYENIVKVSSGSSIKMLMVAEGIGNYYPRYGPTMEWDTCGAHGVLKGVKMNLTDMKNKELIYNKENLLNPFFKTNNL